MTFVIAKDGRLSFALTEDDRGFESFQIGKHGALDEVSGGDQMGGYPYRFYDAGAFAGRSLLTAMEDELGLPRVPWPKMKVESVNSPPSPDKWHSDETLRRARFAGALMPRSDETSPSPDQATRVSRSLRP